MNTIMVGAKTRLIRTEYTREYHSRSALGFYNDIECGKGTHTPWFVPVPGSQSARWDQEILLGTNFIRTPFDSCKVIATLSVLNNPSFRKISISDNSIGRINTFVEGQQIDNQEGKYLLITDVRSLPFSFDENAQESGFGLLDNEGVAEDTILMTEYFVKQGTGCGEIFPFNMIDI